MTSNLPIGTEVETTRKISDAMILINGVHSRGNIPAGRVYTITEKTTNVDPVIIRYWGTYVYRATATVDGDTHTTEFSGDMFDNGSVIVSMRKRKINQRGRDLTSVKRVGLDKNLPNELEGLIGQFLSGKKGTIDGQMDQLQQEKGKPMAPRPIGRGGRTHRRWSRKTRRNHK